MTSCDNTATSQEAINNYYLKNNIPNNSTLFIANGLGCYHCNKTLVETFFYEFKSDERFFLITCDSSFFDLKERKMLRAIPNAYIDRSNLIRRLNYQTGLPTIVDRREVGSEKVFGLTINNIDSVLTTFH